MDRADAPQPRITSKKLRTECEPSVSWSLVAIRLLYPDIGLVRVEFICQDAGQGSAYACAHFGTRRNNRYRIVGLDSIEHIWAEKGAVGARSVAGKFGPRGFRA
jgi:hypothetical protein